MQSRVEPDLAALTRRLERLEERTYGSRPRTAQEPIVHRLAEFSTDVGNSLAGHDRITPIIKRLEELETYLDPMFAETSSQTDRVKQSIVLSQAGQIQRDYNTLEQIKELSGELNGGKMGDIEEVSTKMENLKRIQLEERAHSDALNRQTLELVEKYNKIISDLTTAFLQADATVAAAEEKTKKPVYY